MLNSLELAAMQASLKATTMQQQAISHNLSNYETPGFKAKSVSFDEVYANEIKKGGDGRYKFEAKVNTRTDTEVRADGNNVDIEKENLALYETYMQSVALYQKIGGTFTNFRYVLSNAPR
ncbi:MAG: flagellar biosynthesis protein FlgB [Oscillospiraceae bacterium]